MVAVTEVGQGPTLLFVHTGFWSLIWRDVITRLAGEFRCICLDAPGTGQSARRAHEAITLTHASRAVTRVIEALELEDFTIVVHDLGGPAGLAAAAQAPERLRAIVAVNAFAWRPTGAAFRGMLALMGSSLVREFDAWTQFLPRVTASMFGVARSMDATTVKAFRVAAAAVGISFTSPGGITIGRVGFAAFPLSMAGAKRTPCPIRCTGPRMWLVSCSVCERNSCRRNLFAKSCKLMASRGS